MTQLGTYQEVQIDPANAAARYLPLSESAENQVVRSYACLLNVIEEERYGGRIAKIAQQYLTGRKWMNQKLSPIQHRDD